MLLEVIGARQRPMCREAKISDDQPSAGFERVENLVEYRLVAFEVMISVENQNRGQTALRQIRVLRFAFDDNDVSEIEQSYPKTEAADGNIVDVFGQNLSIRPSELRHAHRIVADAGAHIGEPVTS